MSLLFLHPAAAYLLGLLLVLVLPGRYRPLALLATPVLALALLETLAARADAAGAITLTWLGMPLQPLRVDGLGLLFARIFALAGGIGLLYGLHERSRAGHAAIMATVAAALGVVLAGDLLTLFVAWELKALATTAIIATGGMPASMRAAQRYLLMHAAGGTALLIGIACWVAAGNDTTFAAMTLDAGSAWILVGFGLNAAIPPLHAWLTDAYPEGSPAGTVILSAFTTKAAVYALLRGFPGLEVLVWLGVAMALYGVICAMLANDMRRLLAYHIVSQVGFMVCAVGMGGVGLEGHGEKAAKLAFNGGAAHAYSHIIYKGLLLMGAGAVVYATGKRKINELGGLWRHMPFTLAMLMVGALSISGAPLWNGFISKSMVISAAGYAHRQPVELLLTLASVGTFLSTTLKLPWFVFFARDQGARPQRALPWNMRLAMGTGATLCTVYGLAPGLLYDMLPYQPPPGKAVYHPFTVGHTLHTLQLMLGTALVFFLCLRFLAGKPKVQRDAHRIYALVGRATVLTARWLVQPVMDGTARAVGHGVRALPDLGARLDDRLRAPVGVWVMVAVVVLALLGLALQRTVGF